jgi:RNA polymerase sigma-70 factor (ECF subfamily)
MNRRESDMSGRAARLRLASSGPPADAPELGDLLTRVASGDELAFAAVYDALGAMVYGVARRVIRDPSRAEEVAQEVFTYVWQSAVRFDPQRGSAKTWIMTIAHRRAVDAVRHDQAAKNRDMKYDWSPGPDHDVVEEAVTTELEHEQVRRCLDGLTDLQREAVNLAYYQGYTYLEVARRLGVNHSTVKTRMRDGIVRLRDCMGVEA